MSLRRWVVNEPDKALARELSAECGIDSFCALLLTLRGISDPFEAQEFLSDEGVFCDPNCFTDMDLAVERLNEALENQEKIAVFGDYDCDGVTATAVLYTYLISVGANVCYRLPSRDEGYGLSVDAIDELKADGVSLIITVDNGVSAVDEIAYAKKCGIDVVVTDHHLPPDELPAAVAVVDPHRADCMSEFKDFAGVGVAFMFVCAHAGCEVEELLPVYGDLVALGTIADVMPLKNDNRAIVKYGLKMIKQRRRDSITALITAAGMDEREVNSGIVSFGLAPRINAAGRMLSPNRALELLLCDDKNRALPLARDLNDLNLQRQKLESDIIAKAEEMLFADESRLLQPVLVVYGEGWHHGVLGLISGKLSRKYSRPCISFSIDGDKAVGSARSYKGVSIHELLTQCADYTVSFGGHETAAGVTVQTSRLKGFITAINRAAHDAYPLMAFDTLELCCKLNPETLSIAHAYSQKQLEPFGAGNETPVYGLYNMRIVSVNSVGKGNHLKITAARNKKQFEVMKFFTRLEEFPYKTGDVVDFAVTLEIGKFAGEESLSVVVNDIKPSAVDNDYLTKRVRAYENFAVFGEIPQHEPITRDSIAPIYKIIRERRRIFAPTDALVGIFSSDDYFTLRCSLDILSESGLISLCCREFTEISILPVSGKVDLTQAKTYVKLQIEACAE